MSSGKELGVRSKGIEPKLTSFTKLNSWQKAHALVVGIYRATESFPSSEQFGLVNQIRRAVVSITSNIAEGFSRQTDRDKIHFYVMALGSCTEVQNQLIISRDFQFITTDSFQYLADLSIEVGKLLKRFHKILEGSHMTLTPSSLLLAPAPEVHRG